MRVHAIVEKNKTLRPLEKLNLKAGQRVIIDISNSFLEQVKALRKRNMDRNLKIDPEIDISALGNKVNNEIL